MLSEAISIEHDSLLLGARALKRSLLRECELFKWINNRVLLVKRLHISHLCQLLWTSEFSFLSKFISLDFVSVAIVVVSIY